MKQLMISLLLVLSCFSVLAQEKTANREVKKSQEALCLVWWNLRLFYSYAIRCKGISDVEGFYYCRYLVGRSL